MSRRLAPLLMLIAATLSACTTSEPLALHGAGMMRVEVEVYKGPLSVPPSAQMGELVAVMADAVRANAEWRTGALAAMGARQCDARGEYGRSHDCVALQSAVDSAEDAIGAGCYIFDTPVMKDAIGLATYLPVGLCGQYASAWRHIEFKRGTYDAAASHAMTDVQVKALLDGLAGLGVAVKAEDEARTTLASATPADRTAAQTALQNAVKANAAARLAFDNLFFGTLQQPMGDRTSGVQTLARTLGQPTLYDAYMQAVRCAASTGISDEARRLNGLGGDGPPAWPTPVTNTLKCQYEAVVLAVQNMASVLRAAGFRSSFGNARYVSQDQKVRASLTAFAFIAGEYGNQLQSRIAVLAKQLAYDQDRSNLPISDYLRDASNTDAVHLFDWLDATDDQPGLRHPGGLKPGDRVRMVERLTGDYYWTKINDVYASGQGDVTMAFIKDDIGNWNLKSFSNEPGKLLSAYRSAANAAIASAAKLAAKAANPAAAGALKGTDKLLSLARQFATGRVEGDGGSTATADSLLAGLATRIQARRTQFADTAKSLAEKKIRDEGDTGNVAKAQAAATTAKAAEDTAFATYSDARTACTAPPCATVTAAYAKYAEAAAARAAADRAAAAAVKDAADTVAALDGLPAKAAAAIQALIDDQRTDIDALQKAALPPPASPPTVTDVAKSATSPAS